MLPRQAGSAPALKKAKRFPPRTNSHTPSQMLSSNPSPVARRNGVALRTSSDRFESYRSGDVGFPRNLVAPEREARMSTPDRAEGLKKFIHDASIDVKESLRSEIKKRDEHILSKVCDFEQERNVELVRRLHSDFNTGFQRVLDQQDENLQFLPSADSIALFQSDMSLIRTDIREMQTGQMMLDDKVRAVRDRTDDQLSAILHDVKELLARPSEPRHRETPPMGTKMNKTSEQLQDCLQQLGGLSNLESRIKNIEEQLKPIALVAKALGLQPSAVQQPLFPAATTDIEEDLASNHDERISLIKEDAGRALKTLVDIFHRIVSVFFQALYTQCEFTDAFRAQAESLNPVLVEAIEKLESDDTSDGRELLDELDKGAKHLEKLCETPVPTSGHTFVQDDQFEKVWVPMKRGIEVALNTVSGTNWAVYAFGDKRKESEDEEMVDGVERE